MQQRMLVGLGVIENKVIRKILVPHLAKFNILLRCVYYTDPKQIHLDVLSKFIKNATFLLVDRYTDVVREVNKYFKGIRFVLVYNDKFTDEIVELIKIGFVALVGYPLRVDVIYHQIMQTMYLAGGAKGVPYKEIHGLNFLNDPSARTLRVMLRKSGQRLDFMRIGHAGFLQANGKITRFSPLEAALLEQLFIGYKANTLTHLSRNFGNMASRQISNTIARLRKKLKTAGVLAQIKGVYGYGYILKEFEQGDESKAKTDKTQAQEPSDTMASK